MIKRLLNELHELIVTAKRKIGSLNVALMLTLTLGVLIATASYFVVEITARVVIENVYMSPENQKERSDGYADRLRQFVIENGVTAKNSADFTKFMEDNEYVYLMVYSDDELVFGSTENSANYADDPDDIHIIEMADGEKLGVVIHDDTDTFYYTIFRIIATVGSVLALFAVMIVYVQRLTARISKLSREVSLVSGGDARHIHVMRGHDEITELSASVEKMRASILMSVESERAAIEANSELIKSMSHDIRTPLTVLLGYIGMMKESAEGDPLMMEYVLASEKTAMRLKRLSDDLFGYFLLFGEGASNVKFEVLDFRMLAEQMLSEFVFLLSEKEYCVNLDISSDIGGAMIKTDPDMLMRIIENLLSNMFKYADRDKEIGIRACVEDGYCKLEFTNTVYRGENKAETNGIGLKSCRKIADTLGIKFDFSEDGDVYESTIAFPLVQDGISEGA